MFASDTINSPRFSHWLILGVILLSFVVHLRVYHELDAESPYFDVLLNTTDQYFYDRHARELLAGDYPGNEAFFNSPYYTYYLAAAYTVGDAHFTPRYLQVLIGLVTLALVYKIGEMLFSRRIGIAAAIVIVFYGPIIYYNLELTAAPHTTLYFTATVFLALLYQRYSRLSYIVGAGLMIGLGAVSQPQMAVLGLPVLWLIWRRRAPDMRRAILALALAAGAVIALPTLHNYVAGGEFGVITTSGGYNLYIGNNPDSTTTFYVIDSTVRNTYSNSDYVRDVVAYIVQQPLDWVILMVRKTAAFLMLSDAELGSNGNYHFWAVDFSPTLALLPLTVEMISLITLVTIPLVRHNKQVRQLYLFILAFMLATILIFVQARFRITLMPVTILLMVVGLRELIRHVSIPKKRPFALLLGIAILVAYVPLALRYQMLLSAMN